MSGDEDETRDDANDAEAPRADEPTPRESAAPPSPEADEPRRESTAPADEDEGRRRQRRRLEGVLRESFRRAVEKGLEAGLGAIESSVDVLEKGVEAGRGTFQQASTSLKGVVEDVKMPKEVASYVFAQIDETKNVLIRAVAREVHDFLDATDIAYELQRALTSLSFEIKTEIRFIPNEKGLVRAEVKSKAAPHRERAARGAASRDEERAARAGDEERAARGAASRDDDDTDD
jgi:hypothetical protein